MLAHHLSEVLRLLPLVLLVLLLRGLVLLMIAVLVMLAWHVRHLLRRLLLMHGLGMVTPFICLLRVLWLVHVVLLLSMHTLDLDTDFGHNSATATEVAVGQACLDSFVVDTDNSCLKVAIATTHSSIEGSFVPLAVAASRVVAIPCTSAADRPYSAGRDTVLGTSFQAAGRVGLLGSILAQSSTTRTGPKAFLLVSHLAFAHLAVFAVRLDLFVATASRP